MDPTEAAQMQCDKHIVKMSCESAQMLSTAHRMLDGEPDGKRWVHSNELLYNVVHKNHPCTKWTMETTANYAWHYLHFVALCKEYTFRYGKVHASFTKLNDILSFPPKNLPLGPMTEPALAMGTNPECIFPGEPVKSYRCYYKTKQARFNMTWKNRDVPSWFTT
jgi:hypothetical protein